MLHCYIKYRNGCSQICRATKRDALRLLDKNDDIVQVIVYKNGRVCADYIKTIHY